MNLRNGSEMILPDVMRSSDGSVISDPAEWPARRNHILEILAENVYGTMPAPPEYVIGEALHFDNEAYGGKCSYSRTQLRVHTAESEYSFPVQLMYPNTDGTFPVIVYISQSQSVPSPYLPAEEIIDRGYGIAMFCVDDITPAERGKDISKGFSSFSEIFSGKKYTWGKIGMWAWAASCLMDYLYTTARIDTDNMSAAGHGICGAAALWATACDTRFKYVLSNNGGIFGDSAMSFRSIDQLRDIEARYPGLVTAKYARSLRNGEEIKYDQHFLLSAIAPRKICITTSAKDMYSSPEAQYACINAASGVYKMLGGKGFVEDEKHGTNEKETISCSKGDIAFYLREGTPFLRRDCWDFFLSYIDKNMYI